jgi:hypothetical protein
VKDVPILVTYDVHTHAMHSASKVERYLEFAQALHDELDIRASFFCSAEAAQQMKERVRGLLEHGHEIGCHGLTHRSEYYDAMPAAVQAETLRRATLELEDVIGQRVTFFRAPVFKLSGATLRSLEELGYEADLSMNSQRLGLFSSDVLNLTWMIAPRRPYHPDLQRPWRRGASKLWEIPLSCFLVPFMINTGLALGSAFMRAFFRGLHLEARCVRKPIVYMSHPEDVCPDRPSLRRPALQWRDLIPTRAQGFQVRKALYETDAKKVARLSATLLECMRRAPRVRFLTVPEYVAALNRKSPIER